MAGVARSSCQKVTGRLPPCLDAVVASCAGARHNPCVFESCPSPANRPMATVAAHGRWNVCAGLALCGTSIVAFGAGSWSHSVVCKKRRGPTRRPMAAAAIDRGRKVIRRLKGGNDSPAW